MIQIDKGVPMPKPARRGGGRARMYPYDEMEVGDSFVTDFTKASQLGGSRTLAQKRTGFKFRAMVVDGKVRVWRVA